MNPIIRSAAALGLVAIAGTSLLTGVHSMTAERIAEQERQVVLRQLGQLIPGIMTIRCWTTVSRFRMNDTSQTARR